MKTIYLSIFLLITLFLFALFLEIIVQKEGYENKNNNINMKDLNVIFAGTVRNCEEYISEILGHIDNAGKKFNSYLLIIYENDSTDNTKQILIERKKSNYIYLFEDGIEETRRTVRISNGRNKILDVVDGLKADYDYLIMLDMDDVNVSGKFVDTIDTCFQDHQTSWDVLAGNQSGRYYDIWALRKPQLLDYDYLKVKDGFKDIFFPYDDGLIPVTSAFGGIAIYNLKSVSDCRYNGTYPDGTEKCEHVDFNDCITQKGGNIYINTSFLTS
jgi:hypothetical protein